MKSAISTDLGFALQSRWQKTDDFLSGSPFGDAVRLSPTFDKRRAKDRGEIMSSLVFRPLRQFAQAFAANETPRQIGWGFVLGMYLGLVPKDNLTVLLLATLLGALRVNRPAGLLAAGIFSLLGLMLDPFAHHLGAIVLLWEPARPFYVWLYQLPLGPVSGLNNTVVVGHLLIALYLTLPVYRAAYYFADRVQPRVSRWLLRSRAIRLLRGMELGTQLGGEA